jgi:hypothetical protein
MEDQAVAKSLSSSACSSALPPFLISSPPHVVLVTVALKNSFGRVLQGEFVEFASLGLDVLVRK